MFVICTSLHILGNFLSQVLDIGLKKNQSSFPWEFSELFYAVNREKNYEQQAADENEAGKSQGGNEDACVDKEGIKMIF